MGSDTSWMTLRCWMALNIWAGEPAPEIRPLMKTLVSITRRGGNFSSTTPVFSNRPHGLRDSALDFCLRDTTVGRLHLGDRFPGVNVPEDSPNDEGLSEDSANRGSFLKSFLGHLLVNAGGHPDMNLAIEWSRHINYCTTIPWYVSSVFT